MMKYKALAAAALILFVGLLASQPVHAKDAVLEAVLEEYSIGHGGTLGGPPAIVASLSDPFFGNGDAEASIEFDMEDETGSLALKVWRVVEPGNISFALLVFRVEVRAHDEAGTLVFSRDLDGFTFGDSMSGIWTEVLNELPSSIRQVGVTFFGNYE
jgi:hypothetical protein